MLAAGVGGGHNRRRGKPGFFKGEEQAAIHIQRIFRRKRGADDAPEGLADEDIDPAELVARERAALHIQRHFRGRAARRRVERMRMEKNDSSKGSLQRLRIVLWFFMEESESSLGAKIASIVILSTIVVSILCFTIQTMPELRGVVHAEFWEVVEVGSTVIFTAEYLTRLMVCTVSGSTVAAWVREPANLCDLLAILPFYIEASLSGTKQVRGLRILRAVRLIRLFRVFKLGRYSSGMRLMFEAIKESGQALILLVFLLCIGVVLFGSVLYFLERLSCPDREPWAPAYLEEYDRLCRAGGAGATGKTYDGTLCCDKDNNPRDFASIASACWWAIVTMTTVGYGDKYPKTLQGKLIGVACMLTGILLIALPTAIVGHKFQEVYHNMREEASQRQQTQTSKSWGRSLTQVAQARNLRTGSSSTRKEGPSPPAQAQGDAHAHAPRQAWGDPSPSGVSFRDEPARAPEGGTGEGAAQPDASEKEPENAGDTGSSLSGSAGRLYYLLEKSTTAKRQLSELQAREQDLQAQLKEEIRALVTMLGR